MKTRDLFAVKHVDARKLKTGETVLLRRPGIVPGLEAKWVGGWIVVRERHPTYWIHHPSSGAEKVVHRERLQWVPPDTEWRTSLEGTPPPYDLDTGDGKTPISASDPGSQPTVPDEVIPPPQLVADVPQVTEMLPPTPSLGRDVQSGETETLPELDPGQAAAPSSPLQSADSTIPNHDRYANEDAPLPAQPPIRMKFSRETTDSGRITRSTPWKVEKL